MKIEKKIKKTFLFLVGVLFLYFSSIAQIPSGYYDLANGKTGEILRAALRDITTTGHVKIPYTSSDFDIWDAYAITDVKPTPNNTIIWDMYSDIPSGVPAYTFTIYTSQCGTASEEGDCYAREHLMANSFWGGIDDDANPQYSDLHHLFPADQYVNNRKSNNLVAQTLTPTWTSTNGSKVGPCTYPGFTGAVFEPINEYKGDFARAFLYLAARYMDQMSTWVTTYPTTDAQYIINSTGGNYKQWFIDMLILWNNSDPVSQKEIDRNNNIYWNTPQHNRNPFIDHPEFVCQVWSCPTSPVITNITHTPTYPNSVNSVSVSASVTDDVSVTSVTLQWCTDGISFNNSIIMNVSGAPNYVSASSIPAQPASTTVSYRIIAIDNEDNSSTSLTNSYKVIKDEPTDYPTSLSCGISTSTSISLTWNDATTPITPDGYLIKASSVSFVDITDPIDGIKEDDGLFVKNIAQGTQTVKFTGLVASTTYYFKIYPYSNSLININYKTAPTAPNTSCVTSAGGSGSCATDLIISEYIEGSGSNKYIEISNNTGAAVDLAGYKLQLFSNGALTASTSVTLAGMLNDQTTIVYKNTSATVYGGIATTNAAVNYNGNDAVALYKISSSSYVDIFGRIGENPGTAWTSGSFTTIDKTLVRNSLVTSGVSTNPTSGFPTLATEWTQYTIDDVSYLGAHSMTCPSCAAPTLQASNITFSSVTKTSMTINWTNGNGENRIVVMCQGYPISETPVEGITYFSSSVFGLGDELGPDEYVVYNNSGSSVTVSNLIEGQSYYVSIFEYNCLPESEIYLTPSATSSQITYSLTTGLTPDNQYCVSTSLGYATTINFTSTGEFTGNTYTAQLSDPTGSFDTPINIGSVASNLNTGIINCIIPANTANGTGYLIRVISNGPTIIGTSSNPFEVISYTPCIAPVSANSSRNNIFDDDGGTIDLSVIGGFGSTLAWYTSSCGETLIGTGSPLNIAAPTTTTTYYARWENSCSNSVCASVTIYVSAHVLPDDAGIITGSTTVCQGENSVTYTVPVIQNANSYIWTLPSGATGTSTTNEIDVDYGATAVSGDISVFGHNGLGDGVASTLAITVNPLPLAAETITGNATVCQGESSVTYTIPVIENANSYIWSLPDGATGTSTTNEITLDYGVTAVSGDITVFGNNYCGDGESSTLAITINNKPETPIITQTGNILQSDALNGNQWYNSNGLINGAINQEYTVTSNETYYVIVTINGCSSEQSNSINVITIGIDILSNNISFEVYPNPVSNELIIEQKGNLIKTGFVIYNSSGQIIFRGNLLEKAVVYTTNFPSGIYIIKLENGNTFELKKIIKK